MNSYPRCRGRVRRWSTRMRRRRGSCRWWCCRWWGRPPSSARWCTSRARSASAPPPTFDCAARAWSAIQWITPCYWISPMLVWIKPGICPFIPWVGYFKPAQTINQNFHLAGSWKQERHQGARQWLQMSSALRNTKWDTCHLLWEIVGCLRVSRGVGGWFNRPKKCFTPKNQKF